MAWFSRLVAGVFSLAAAAFVAAAPVSARSRPATIPLSNFTVTPSTGLRDQEHVTVSWTAIFPGPGEAYAVAECLPDVTDTVNSHCTYLGFDNGLSADSLDVVVFRAVGVNNVKCSTDGSKTPCIVVLSNSATGHIHASRPVTFAPK
jgi:hypothetical protein